MLKTLPDISFPITKSSINPLMDCIVQLNTQDAGLPEGMQRALGIYFHTYDLFVKSKGRINYLGRDGRERLKQDASMFVQSQIVTRNGDLSAAHLAIDYSDTIVRCREMGITPLTGDVAALIAECTDMQGMSVEMEKRVGLLMDMLGKKSVV
jgi:hypothetical protein